jgi:hypothetical protein
MSLSDRKFDSIRLGGDNAWTEISFSPSAAEGKTVECPSALEPVPRLGVGSASSWGKMGSSLGGAPGEILVCIAAVTFPETMVHLARGFYCYNG